MTAAENKTLNLIARIATPSTTAVLTIELQKGIVGKEALLPALSNAVAEAGVLTAAGRVCAAAREAGARVVHCTVEERSDGAGFAENCRIFALSAKRRRERESGDLDIGSVGAQLVDELNVQLSDIVVPRLSGMTAFTPSALDQVLRNMGITTVVLVGVSVNLGIFGGAMTALDLGYQVIVVRDAVAGVPKEYAQMVLENSIANIARQ